MIWNFRERGLSHLSTLKRVLSIMDDAGGKKNGLVDLAQSRKQDRFVGLLGWWVLLVLILPTLAWKPVQAGQPNTCENGEGKNCLEVQKTASPPTLLKNSMKSETMHWGKSARTAPTSLSRVVPYIDRSRVDPGLLKSAEGIEGIFFENLFKVMRQTVPKSDMDLESSASQIYRSMLDVEYAQKAAHPGKRGQGVGLADQIIAYFYSRGYYHPQGQGVPKKEKP